MRRKLVAVLWMIGAVGLGVAAGEVTVRPAEGGSASRPATAAATATSASKPATTKGAVAQDGPGLYKVSAGPGLKYTATVRAKSRADAIDQAIKTVGKKAMDFDENVDMKELKVERIGP